MVTNYLKIVVETNKDEPEPYQIAAYTDSVPTAPPMFENPVYHRAKESQKSRIVKALRIFCGIGSVVTLTAGILVAVLWVCGAVVPILP